MAELTFDRYQAENALIGALLLDERETAGILAAVDAADILDPANLRIFQAARALFAAGMPVDPITVRDKLGLEYQDRIARLLEITPTAANWQAYARLVHEQAALQRVRDIAAELTSQPTLEACRDGIAALVELSSAGQRLEAWTMADAYRWFMADQSAEERREYVTYGVAELDGDSQTELGDVVIIGGEPSSGKTAFALAAAYHMAERYNVGFFSLETGPKKLTHRLVSTVLGLPLGRIKHRQLTHSDWALVAERGQEVSARRLTIIQAASMTAAQMQAVSRSYGFDVIYIDYVQLVTPEGNPRASAVEQVRGISQALHRFAQSSGTLVVELAQLSRQQNAGKWRAPTMHDLKESGQLEQDADTVLLLYKPRPNSVYHDEPVDETRSRYLSVAKQKEGPLGCWLMRFDGARQRFRSWDSPASDEVMRRLTAGGRAARQTRRAQAASQSPGQMTLEEVPDDGTEPF